MSADLGPVSTASLGRSAARGSIITVSTQLTTLIVQLVGLLVLARILGPGVYGRLAIAVSFATLAGAIVLMGIPMAVAQSPNLSSRARSLLFLCTTGLGILCGGILALLAPGIAHYYGDQELRTLVLCASLLPVLSGIQSQFRLELVLKLRFVALGLTDVSAQLCGTLLALNFAFRGQVFEAVVSQLLGQALLQLVIAVCVARWRPTRPGDWSSDVVPVLKVGANLLGVSLLREASRLSIIPLIATSLPVAQVGTYDRLQQIAVSPGSVAVDQLQRVMVPVLSRVRADPVRLQRFSRTGHLGLIYSAFTGYLVMAVLATPLVEVLLGPKWGGAGAVLRLLAVGGGFVSLGRSMQWLFIGSGATLSSLKLSLWVSPVVVLLTLAGLPWGLEGVALGAAAGGAILWPVSVVLAARAAGVSVAGFFRDFLRVLVSWCLPLMLGAWVGAQIGVSHVLQLLCGVFGAAAVALAMYVFWRPVRADVGMFLGLLKGD
ncbi:oligosaccharide flippase family protein [Terrabacter sp. 2YAF2]|uniref:oligosaccharide flippase family protein n=1 Tax=Terrabacter sp. 2YAF2 TaxID=3233026 RepID=UPI003F9B5ADD